jgi:hypothetical protein
MMSQNARGLFVGFALHLLQKYKNGKIILPKNSNMAI